MNTSLKKIFLYVVVVIVGGGIVVGLLKVILASYQVTWTGFGDYYSPNGDFVRGKTFWDWMELLIIPLVLTVGAIVLNNTEKKLERENLKNRLQEETLQTYLNQMLDLMLKEKLPANDDETVRHVARTKTLTVLRSLDGMGKRHVLLFLRESKFIGSLTSSYVFRMKGADLRGAYLSGADLGDIDLEEVDLRNANLSGARLFETNLRKSDLRYANLQNADFHFSSCVGADMRYADFRNSWMLDANFTDVNFQYANFRGAAANLQPFIKEHPEFFKGAKIKGTKTANQYTAGKSNRMG